MWILLVLLIYSDGHENKFEHSRWADSVSCDKAAYEVALDYLRNPEPIAVITECAPAEPQKAL